MSNTDRKLIDAYELVIADLSEAEGYEADIKAITIGALGGRLYELTDVWPFFDIVKQLEEEDNG
jgi:hypothetical protein